MSKTDKEHNKKKEKRPLWLRILRFLAKTVLIFFLIFFLIVLFIRSPWGQDIIVQKVTDYVSEKTHTKVEIERLFIKFSGDISLEGLYLEDKKGDTLVYSKNLNADVPIWPIVMGNGVAIDQLDWQGLRANVTRKDSIAGFNYQFLIDAFASDTATPPPSEEESKPMSISIGDINLKDFRVNYDDAVAGMQAKLNLGELEFQGKETDLEHMRFHVGKAALNHTKIQYKQTKAIVSEEDTTASPLPFLRVDQLELNDVQADYQSVPDEISAQVNLQHFVVELPKADLNKQQIELDQIALNDSEIVVNLPKEKAEPDAKAQPEKPNQAEEGFTWPDWDVQIHRIDLENNHIVYHQGDAKSINGQFNPQAIDLKKLTFKTGLVSLRPDETASAKVEQLSFQEGSGFNLNKFGFDAEVTSNKITISSLGIETNKSRLAGDAKIEFSSFDEFLKQPENARFSINLPNFKVFAEEAFRFQPDLKKNEMLKNLTQHPFTGTLIANGTLKQLNLSKVLVNWGRNTSLVTNGSLNNVTDTDKLTFNIPSVTVKTVKNDLQAFVSEEDLGISIPKEIFLHSSLKGSLTDLQTDSQLKIPNGEIKLKGDFKNKNELAFDANLQVIELNLGEILKNPALDKVTFDITATGKGKDMNSLDAKLDSDFTKLTYNGYDLSSLKLKGDLKNGEGNVQLDFKDDNLNLDMDSAIKLDSVSPEIKLNLDLKGANLYALGLTKKKIRAKVLLKADFKGNADNFKLTSNITDGVAVYDERPYYLGDIDISSSVTKDSTALKIASNFLNTELESNASPDVITGALQRHLKTYFSDSVQRPDTLGKPVKLKMNLTVNDSPILSQVFLEGIKEMDTLKMDIDFDEKAQKLSANLGIPFVNYNDSKIDSLHFKLNSDGEKANFSLGFASIESEPLAINQTYFNGSFAGEKLNLNFNAFDGDTPLYRVRSEISGKNDNVHLHIVPDSLILNKEKWQVPAENQLTLGGKKLTSKDFVFSRNNQEIKFSDELGPEEPHFGVAFKNFKLTTFTSYFNPDDYLASGMLQGDFIMVKPFQDMGMVADLGIDDLEVIKTPLGKLTLKAKSTGSQTYDFNLALKGEPVDMDLTGDYVAATTGAKLNLDLDLQKLSLTTIQQFTGEEIKDASGSIAAKVNVSGTPSEPKYEGFFKFNEAAFNVSKFNSKFVLSDEKIKLDNAGIYFNDFTIEDENKNDFTINGDILTEDLTDPEFDLQLSADNFQVLNSTKEDYDLFYGKVSFDVKAKITGKSSFPKVSADFTVNNDTDVTYVIQQSQLAVQQRDGVVVFVNKENPDRILTKTDESETAAILNGIDLKARLHINPEAKIGVILSERTGDNLSLSGEGDLIFSIEHNGRTTLTGRYEITDGHYEMNLYKLVNRKFDLAAGSTISWHGDPMDADLDVRAIYKVETSASALMASQPAGSKQKFRQELPFLVYLNVNGELMQPKLGFSLDMPEAEQGAIGGQVYSRISQLNQQPDALNKQVFSLLVLNRFYPASGSDGSQGGAATIARDNLNQALSDQLNVFSDKLLGNTGVQLNFGLDSYTDYQGDAPQDRTKLDISAKKSLFNDRLVVQAGSEVNVQGDSRPGETNPVIGNVSIEYLLTKDGRWRLKGFRKSEYENIIDGQVFVSGIALIFQREFNKFKELWDGSVKEIQEEKEQQKEEAEKKEAEKKEAEKKKKKDQDDANSEATNNEENE